ncbi:MAG: Nif11-like leader peptide family natural product precursor [Desulfuromonadaceae bacterium]|nr:Nif11-like leader peptide family natural product precursor [Desulfuromonadaceae bacterium]
MSIESAQAFLERMKTDEEFAKNVTECKDSEARRSYVKEAGFDFTPEEALELRGELSDGQLDLIGGGVCSYFDIPTMSTPDAILSLIK